MVAWKRFTVPEFDAAPFKDMVYEPPEPLAISGAEALIERAKSGDESVIGGHVVMPEDALFERFAFQGEKRHAVLCVLPPARTHLLGRSWAWRIQRTLILDALDARGAKVLYDWRTPRPMNTCLGPEDGVTLDAGPVIVLTGNKYAEHWLGNRSIVENDWAPGAGKKGFRILAGSDESRDDFHHCYLAFEWDAIG